MISEPLITPEEKTAPRLPALFWVGFAVIFCALAATVWYGISKGIASRVQAATTLKRDTLDMAIQEVSVVHPKRGAPAEEVVLPGNAQAYVATPIYARTNGYIEDVEFRHRSARQSRRSVGGD